MGIDIAAVLAQSNMAVAIHNVRLIAVQPGGGPDGTFERLTVEHDGATHELIGGGKWNEQYSLRNVGKFGHVVQSLFGHVVQAVQDNAPAGACYFREYYDQSLRRAPELDVTDSDPYAGRARLVVGWRCDTWPKGFRAPVGIIPGKNGSFVHDETIAVTVRVPPEFVRQCRRVQMKPHDVLQGFIGDLAGIQNYCVNPRADRLGSGGSDERMYAESWLLRAYGHDEVNVDELELQEKEAEDKQWQRDDFAALLDAFEDAGGEADDLFAAVDAIIAQKKSGADTK